MKLPRLTLKRLSVLLRRRAPHIAGVLAAVAVAVFLFLEALSFGAAQIFNYAMANQDMLRGTITVDQLMADFTGHVHFTNLVWKDVNDEPILIIPSGDFRVRLWDVATRNYKSTTIQELTVNDAIVSLHFDKHGRLDFIRPTPDMELDPDDDDSWLDKVRIDGLSEHERRMLGEKKRQLREQKVQKKWQNFNRDGRKIKLDLHVHNSRFEIFYNHMLYLMSHVELDSVVNTEKEMAINATIGGFGGTMVGDGITVRGNLALGGREEPDVDLALIFYAVQPSSLGIDMDIKDKMTLDTYFTGPLSHPEGSGSLMMDQLNIPGLKFEQVHGDLVYHGPHLEVTDLYAKVYGGDFHAHGDYDFDTRYYNIYGKGTGLHAQDALPGAGLSCPVELDLSFSGKGSPKKTYAEGTFTSGPGFYHHFPFKSISGKVVSGFHDLQFSDVKIEFNGFTMTTDGFRIKDKKLTLDPIDVADYEGNHMYTYRQEKK